MNTITATMIPLILSILGAPDNIKFETNELTVTPSVAITLGTLVKLQSSAGYTIYIVKEPATWTWWTNTPRNWIKFYTNDVGGVDLRGTPENSLRN